MQILTKIKEWLFGNKIEKITESKDGSVLFIESVNLPRESQENFYLDLMDRLRRLGYQVRQLTPYQFRIEGRLDVYPVNRKWHDIKSNKRGSYGDVIDFVRTFFNDPNV